MKKFIALILILLVGLVTLQFIRKNSNSKTKSTKSPRIVSLAPSFTEIVFELEAGSQIVGVTTYCTYPPEAKSKKMIGDFVQPNFEMIASLTPDLVLAEHWTSSKTVPSLRRLGMTVLETPNPKSFEDIYTNIQKIRIIKLKFKAVQDQEHCH